MSAAKWRPLLSRGRWVKIKLTHWGRETQICVGNLTIIGSDNGLSPERRQAIIWTNAGILLIGALGTNFSEILTEIQTFLLKKIHLKISSAKYCSFRLGLNVLSNPTPGSAKRMRMALTSLPTKSISTSHRDFSFIKSSRTADLSDVRSSRCPSDWMPYRSRRRALE